VTLAEQLTEPQGPSPQAGTSTPETQPPPSITS
jgi:hypothetical protein